jgi:tetratricopeptide (TPR) repeat protein
MGRKDEADAFMEQVLAKCYECFHRYKREGNVKETLLAKEQVYYTLHYRKGKMDSATMTAGRELVRTYIEFGRHQEAEEHLRKLIEDTERGQRFHAADVSDLSFWARVLNDHPDVTFVSPSDDVLDDGVADDIANSIRDKYREEDWWLDHQSLPLMESVVEALDQRKGGPAKEALRVLITHSSEQERKYRRNLAYMTEQLAGLGVERETPNRTG